MVALSVDFTVSEADAERAADLLGQLAAAVSQESGNLCYEVLRLRQSPPVFRVYERYASPEAFAEHRSSEHMARLFPEFRGLLTAAPAIVEYDFVAAAHAS